jgi:hypothetical protein
MTMIKRLGVLLLMGGFIVLAASFIGDHHSLEAQADGIGVVALNIPILGAVCADGAESEGSCTCSGSTPYDCWHAPCVNPNKGDACRFVKKYTWYLDYGGCYEYCFEIQECNDCACTLS